MQGAGQECEGQSADEEREKGVNVGEEVVLSAGGESEDVELSGEESEEDVLSPGEDIQEMLPSADEEVEVTAKKKSEELVLSEISGEDIDLDKNDHTPNQLNTTVPSF